MTRTLIAASMIVLASQAHALQCRLTTEDQTAPRPPICTHSKNTEECPPPSSVCAGSAIPIEASLVCYPQGWGVMACFGYPTSEDGIFTYNWSIRGDNELPRVGFGPPDATLACSEGNQRISVTVTDVFGQSETVETFGFCREGYPD
jgi:hypothetical protein